jgi:pimeloyl-ACP methyl ester carboxylesterase
MNHARRLPASKYCAVIFNYDSFPGIDKAAEELAAHLRFNAARISQDGLFFVAHSMGGLVTRFCITKCLGTLANKVRGVVLLGTPNDGTLNNGWMLARILKVGDRLTNFSPYYRTQACRSAQQLTLCDAEKLIENLNAEQRAKPATFSTITIAGGLRYLEVGNKPNLLRDWLSNKMIQRALGFAQNDGLVPETSVDLSGVLRVSYGYCHRPGYHGYDKTNHSGLAANQFVSNEILALLDNVTRDDRST